jgi:hypothetical protein
MFSQSQESFYYYCQFRSHTIRLRRSVINYFAKTWNNLTGRKTHDLPIQSCACPRPLVILPASGFSVAFSAFFFYFEATLGMKYACVFFAVLIPAVVSFFHWFGMVQKDVSAADYDHATRECLLASGGMNIFFIIALVLSKTS